MINCFPALGAYKAASETFLRSCSAQPSKVDFLTFVLGCALRMHMCLCFSVLSLAIGSYGRHGGRQQATGHCALFMAPTLKMTHMEHIKAMEPLLLMKTTLL